MRIENFVKSHKILLIVIFVGVILRFSGLKWGYPFIFQPDEDTLIRGAIGIRFDPNPHHFDWPTMQTYLLFIIISAWAKFTDVLQFLGLRNFFESTFPIWFDRPFVFYLWGRIISALSGSGSLVLLYIIANKIFKSNKLSLVAVLILALSLQNIEDSHFATLDSSLTFWMLLVFYFAQKIYETGRLKYYILSGVFAGVATSTKYNGASIVIAILAYHFLTALKNKKSLLSALIEKDIWISGFFALLGFLIGTPYAILDFRTFISSDSPKGALWQFSRQKGVGFLERYLNAPLLETRFRGFSFKSLGILASLLFLWGFLKLSIYKYKSTYLPMLLFTIFYLLYVGQFPQFLSQYFNPLYPFLALIASYAFFEVLKGLSGLKSKLFLLLSLAFLVILIYRAFLLTYVFSTKDTRIQARDYIYKVAKPNIWVAMAGADKVELEEYNNKTNIGYNIKSLSFLIDAVGRHETEKFVIDTIRNDYKIEYVIVGDYGLDYVLSHPYNPGFEDYSSSQWAVQNLQEVVRFKPRFYNEPWVIIYKL